MYIFAGMFTYNEKSRTYWFSKTCMDNDSEFNLVGVVSFAFMFLSNVPIIVNYHIRTKETQGQLTFCDIIN